MEVLATIFIGKSGINQVFLLKIKIWDFFLLLEWNTLSAENFLSREELNLVQFLLKRALSLMKMLNLEVLSYLMVYLFIFSST